MTKTYCIRPDYVPRTEAATIEGSFQDYWTPERIARSMDYQFEVYRLARDLCDRHSLASVADIGCGVATKLDHFFGHLHPTGLDQPTVAGYIAATFPRVDFRPIDLERPEGVLSRSDRFDLTICADVVEHLLDPDPLMDFLRAHTARFCVLSTPERDIERGPDALHSAKPEHVREWNRSEFARYVQQSGFRIIAHELLPKGRLAESEQTARSASTAFTREWHGCQVVVCTPA